MGEVRRQNKAPRRFLGRFLGKVHLPPGPVGTKLQQTVTAVATTLSAWLGADPQAHFTGLGLLMALCGAGWKVRPPLSLTQRAYYTPPVSTALFHSQNAILFMVQCT